MTENNIDILAGILWRIGMNFILISLDYWKKNRQQTSDDTGIKINNPTFQVISRWRLHMKEGHKTSKRTKQKTFAEFKYNLTNDFLFFCW